MTRRGLAPALILEARSSHLYPGAVLTMRDGPIRLAGGRSRKCLVVFADGSAATAALRRSGLAYRLEAQGYVTARGTAIAVKSWLLGSDATGAMLRVRARIPVD